MSKITPKFKGFVENGKLRFEGQTKDTFDMWISTLDGFVDVTVNKHSEKSERSNNQNRYMWGVVYKLLSEETGYTVDEIHEICKSLHLSKKFTIGSKMLNAPYTSTTRLNTSEMEEYLSKIREWASIELGCYVPLPNEVEY